MVVLGYALAVVMGMLLGLLGGGGSILAVPILVYVIKMAPKEAIAMSLAIVGVTSLFGMVGHWRARNVNFRIAWVFGAVAMAGTFLGAKLSVFFSGAAQLTLFAAVMLVAAFFMMRKNKVGEVLEEASRPAEMKYSLIVAEGLFVGVLTGLVGVGGGFLIVPALVLLGKVPMKEAVGTSLLVIALKSFAGFLGYLDQVSVDWVFLTSFSTLSVLGALLGSYLVRFIPKEKLRQGFAVFLVIMGLVILYQNRATFLAVLT